MNNKYIVAGGSGFIGSAIANALVKDNNEVTVLTRGQQRVSGRIKFVNWDAKTVNPSWQRELENAFAVINLTGESINKRFTPKNKKLIISSRVDSVLALSEAINLCSVPPKCWIQGSAIGYYGNTGSNVADENYPKGKTFLADVVELWENSFAELLLPDTRKVIIRIGQVLGDGGMLKPLSLLTKFFLGGQIGNGNAGVSWIHIEDLVRIVIFAAENNISGIFNAVSPSPTSNKELMSSLRKALNRPWSPPAPSFAARIGGKILGTDPELIFSDTRAVPKRLMNLGFHFNYTGLYPALESILKDGK
jgi:uncharacterized protein (TIGR01777 family)